MYFWTLPGPVGVVLGGAVVAVETSLTMGCTLGTVVVTGEVVVEPEPGAEVLRDRTWGRKEGSANHLAPPPLPKGLRGTWHELPCGQLPSSGTYRLLAASLRPERPWQVALPWALRGLSSTLGLPHGAPRGSGLLRTLLMSLSQAPHTCWVDEALEDEDITINLVGGGEG